MKTKTHVKAGRLSANHNQVQVRGRRLTVKTGSQAGVITYKHNEALLRA